jgi:TRAP-type C4-dicarboxylate transport system permease small subunit
MIARIWQVPRFLPYMAIPLGSALLTVECLRRAAFYLRARDPEAELRESKAGSHL